MRLVVTRPAPDAERTAAALMREGHQIDLAPLMRIEPVPEAAIGGGPWSGVIFTSANAVRAAAELAGFAALTRLRVFAVGARTAAAAHGAGFADVVLGGGSAHELTQALCQWARIQRASTESEQRTPRDPLLYLAGEDLSHDLAGELAAIGETVNTVTVYRAVKVARFPAAVDVALAGGQIDGVLHFSRRSVEAYLDCARAAALLAQALRAAHYCISQQAAAPLVAAGATRIHVAARPDEASLVAMIGAIP